MNQSARQAPQPPMFRPAFLFHAALLASLMAAGCAGKARLTVEQGTGPHPELPAPRKSLLPTLNIAPAVGWPQGVVPRAAEGLSVHAFAAGLDHPRWLYVLPNGDVLVAESNAPPKPDDAKGIKGWVMKKVMKRAGAGVASANRIELLRDADGDGVAETRTTLLRDLNSPFGMALVGNDLYIADSDAVLRFAYVQGATHIDTPGVKLLDLPAGTINHHWTKNLIASRDGTKLYVTVGSNSNVGENGMAVEAGRAAIWEVERSSGAHRVFATGIRNPNGLAWVGDADVLWAVANERDELGGDLVPDYMTSVVDGGFYGWPYSYYGQHVDDRVKPQRPDLVAKAIAPDYALGPHTASLGLAYSEHNALSSSFQHGMFVGQHGSWNRNPRSGYRVIFVPFKSGTPADARLPANARLPAGMPIEVLGGFLSGDGKAQGRPVGVAFDRAGALLVADDVGNAIWRVSAATSAGGGVQLRQ